MPSLTMRGTDTREILFGLDAKSNVASIKCPICGDRVSMEMATFSEHIATHMEKDTCVECPICLVMKSKKLLYYNTADKTVFDTTKPFKKSLEKHITSKHRFCCAMCSETVTEKLLDMHLSSTRHTFTNLDLSQTTSKSADFTKSEINHKNLKSSLSKTEPEQNKKPHKPPMIPKSLRKSTKRGTMKIPKLPVPSKPKETEIIPYIFERTSVREGTSDWPYLYSIVKTKSSPGRWFTAVTFIMEMDGKFYHVRKDGIGNDINQIHMKCNNGVRQCRWKGVLHRKDRQLTASDPQYYNPENYTELQFSTEKHLEKCTENAHDHKPTAEEAASLPQNIDVDIIKSVSDLKEREAAEAAKALSRTLLTTNLGESEKQLERPCSARQSRHMFHSLRTLEL